MFDSPLREGPRRTAEQISHRRADLCRFADEFRKDVQLQLDRLGRPSPASPQLVRLLSIQLLEANLPDDCCAEQAYLFQLGDCLGARESLRGAGTPVVE